MIGEMGQPIPHMRGVEPEKIKEQRKTYGASKTKFCFIRKIISSKISGVVLNFDIDFPFI
ncbi:hypothetical protein LEP1GSC137_2633 [Leptospira borgpetersenii str. Noumea 25]|nr:hypothetical protein LBBP_03290 [Leptospira borgpetersenii serovar Ballum]ANH01808.1 Uncharacterized protein LB4E_2582 [Leptospira borgpetersenii str. 4E]EKQ99418.1 hypothetical protein LEP1GSC121_2016 [Leptospira borgpetersenii serovar Castellonis str. 200801910]EMO08718.1 hypothetical protein LEP1GSC137_2633 [Leptospira borgpetersenii str. Noumea 25]QHE37876.1 hypothetical protein GS510_14100 [Leptospira borgpetersenii]